MKQNRLCNILLYTLYLVLCIPSAYAADSTQVVAREPIYQGTQVKIDIASPILIPATNQWRMQHYEMAVNVRLARRFYPTLELGYAGGQTTYDTISYSGQGGFFRLGCDLHPLKRHPESPHALLVGVRLGTAVQTAGYTDCWGEIVAGCQVEIAKVNNTAFYMGWMGRFKSLFTRQERHFPPAYIPGFGKRDNIGWGLNYYLGWKF